MQEDAHVKLGWIISFVPRSNIQLMVNKPGQKWHELTVFLERGMQKHEFQLLLKYETTVKWAEIWSSHHGRWEDIHS
jgi:hypothetical protein